MSKKRKHWWACFNSTGVMHHCLRETRRGARAVCADLNGTFYSRRDVLWHVHKIIVEKEAGAAG